MRLSIQYTDEFGNQVKKEITETEVGFKYNIDIKSTFEKGIKQLKYDIPNSHESFERINEVVKYVIRVYDYVDTIQKFYIDTNKKK